MNIARWDRIDQSFQRVFRIDGNFVLVLQEMCVIGLVYRPTQLQYGQIFIVYHIPEDDINVGARSTAFFIIELLVRPLGSTAQALLATMTPCWSAHGHTRYLPDDTYQTKSISSLPLKTNFSNGCASKKRYSSSLSGLLASSNRCSL